MPGKKQLTISENEAAALEDVLQFPLADALFGRRSRRFFRGASIPDGALQYESRHEPLPLSQLERLLVLMAMGGVTRPLRAASVQLLWFCQWPHARIGSRVPNERDFLHR
jgi:hypothetical protein